MTIMDGGKKKLTLCTISVRMAILALATLLSQSNSLCYAQTTKVFLLAGQSNMVGWCYNSTLPQELQAPRSDIQIYWDGAWTYLHPGLGGSSSCFGPEIKLCRDIVDAQPGENIVFIKYAASGTSLWDDWQADDGDLYVDFLNTVDNALLSIGEPEIVGMLWMQGESDAYISHSTLQHAQEYEQNLINFIQHIRANLGVPDLPFVIGRISQSPVWTWRNIVRQAQLNVSQNVPSTVLFDTNDLPLRSDNMHYDTTGTVTLGTRFADAVNTLTLPTNSFASTFEDDILSWRYTIPQDSNRVLIVGVCAQDDDPCDLVINSVKYDYTDMNEVPASGQFVSADGTYVTTKLFYLLDKDLPEQGNYRLEVNFSGNVNKRFGCAVTLVGTDQQAPHAVATNSIQDSNSISTDMTIEADGAWIVDIVGCVSEGTFSANNGQMIKFNIDADDTTIAGSIKPVISAGPTTTGWKINDNNCAIAHSAVAFTAYLNTISGQVRRIDDMPIEGVTVTADSAEISAITDSNGYYEVPVAHNWAGTVEPIKEGCLFGPSERTYDQVSDNLAAQDYEDASACDLDNDGGIGWSDLDVLRENWLKTGQDIPGDLYKDDDNIVNYLDFAEFTRVWEN